MIVFDVRILVLVIVVSPSRVGSCRPPSGLLEEVGQFEAR